MMPIALGFAAASPWLPIVDLFRRFRVAAVLVFDTVASFAAIGLGFPYAYASIAKSLTDGEKTIG